MKGERDKSHVQWQPEGRFDININSKKGIRQFNDQSLIPIEIESLRSAIADIKLGGILRDTFSLWRIDSADRCFKRPKQNLELISFTFIMDGTIEAKHSLSKSYGSADTAVLSALDDLIEYETSQSYKAFGGAILTQDLIKINSALTGEESKFLPSLSLTADMATPGLRALRCSMQSVFQQGRITQLGGDHTFSLIQEIIGYQLLSAWPKEIDLPPTIGRHARPDRLSRALDYINANLSSDLMLVDVAAAAGLSVRALQDNFRRSIGKTPFQYIIDSRLMGVNRDLLAEENKSLSIGEIAKRWGFVHMSDFGRRYRLMYGCTPSEARKTST